MTLKNVTENFACQILSGPNSRDDPRRGDATPTSSLPWLSHQSCQIAGRWLQLVRVSFAGELGWELHTKVEDTAAVFDAVWAAGQKHGLKPFGMFALDSLGSKKATAPGSRICRPTIRSCRAGSSASSNGTSRTSRQGGAAQREAARA